MNADARMLGAHMDDHLLDNAVILAKQSMKVPIKSWNGNQNFILAKQSMKVPIKSLNGNQNFARVLKQPGV